MNSLKKRHLHVIPKSNSHGWPDRWHEHAAADSSRQCTSCRHHGHPGRCLRRCTCQRRNPITERFPRIQNNTVSWQWRSNWHTGSDEQFNRHHFLVEISARANKRDPRKHHRQERHTNDGYQAGALQLHLHPDSMGAWEGSSSSSRRRWGE